jgi:hypothetical protein
MPITNPLQTAQRLEALGFPPRQAQGLAEILEETIQANNQDLKEFIRAEMAALRLELKADIAALETRIERSMRLQLATILSAFVAVTGLAVALIKLLP